MELRSSIRRPVRYTEYRAPELPEFIHSSIPYNPKLPKAAFPTLDEPPVLRPRVQSAVNTPQAPRSTLKQRETPRQAVIFRDPRNASKNSIQRRGLLESELDEAPEMNSPMFPLLEQQETLEDPGEFEAYGYFQADEGGEKKPRAQLSVFKRLLNWSQLADSMKVIIVYELTQSRSFEDAAKLLALTETQINHVMELCQREVQREMNEKEIINRCLARQLGMLMGGAATARSEAYNNILEEELYSNIQDPSTFIINKEDFLRARYFLRKSGEQALVEVAETLWKYYGVQSFPLGFSNPETPNVLDHLAGKELEDEYRTPLVGEDDTYVYMQSQPDNRRKRTALFPSAARSSPSASPLRRRCKQIKFRTSSGLRNSVSAEGQGILEVASAPAAFQLTSRMPKPPSRFRGDVGSESRKCLAELRDIDMAIRIATFIPLNANALDALITPPEPEVPLSTQVQAETDNEPTGSSRASSEDEVSQIVVNLETLVVEAARKRASPLTLSPNMGDQRVEASEDQRADTPKAPPISSAQAILPKRTRAEPRKVNPESSRLDNTQGMASGSRTKSATKMPSSPALKPSTFKRSSSDSEPTAKKRKVLEPARRGRPLVAVVIEAHSSPKTRQMLSGSSRGLPESQPITSRRKDRTPVTTPAKRVMDRSKSTKTTNVDFPKSKVKGPEKPRKLGSTSPFTRSLGVKLPHASKKVSATEANKRAVEASQEEPKQKRRRKGYPNN